MSSPFSRQATEVAAAPAAETLQAHLSAVYALAQQNQHVFASPLGPVAAGDRSAWLPRFVFFGPGTSDVSWRLAFLAGFDARDLRPAHALLGLVERLASRAEEGHGLDLTFFPLVDVAGLTSGTTARNLSAIHWAQTAAPEIHLLEKDARGRGYHGFIRLEAAEPDEEIVTLRVREPAGIVVSPDVELVSSEDCEPFPVRFERGATGVAPTDGPLSIADDLSVQPFELTLRIPATWPDEIYHEAVGAILTRFIHRYRAFQAYGLHL